MAQDSPVTTEVEVNNTQSPSAANEVHVPVAFPSQFPPQQQQPESINERDEVSQEQRVQEEIRQVEIEDSAP